MDSYFISVFPSPSPRFVLSVEIIRAERLRVVHLTSHSAVLEWRPVLSAGSGYYELSYNSIRSTDSEVRLVISSDSSRTELTNLQPETTYTASLRPESNLGLFGTLSVTFTTLPGKRTLRELSLLINVLSL